MPMLSTDIVREKKKALSVALGAMILLFIGVSLATTQIIGIVVLITMSVLLYFSYHLDYGMYILLVLYPMIGWEFHADQLIGALGLSHNGTSFYAPMVDVWTVFLALAYGIYLIRRYLIGEKHRIYIPQIGWYSLFIISALLSLIHVSGIDVSLSIYYIIRFLVFVYFGYVVIGTNCLLTKESLHTALKVVVWLGIFLSAMGIFSLVSGVASGGGIHRAVPVALFGWNPFNYDQVSGHILLAEVLIVPLPISFFLALTAKKRSEQEFYGFATILIALGIFLTFSRAGWLSMGVEMVLSFFVFKKYLIWKKIKNYVIAGTVIALPMIVYMGIFSTSAIVSSSNSARFMLTEVGWDFFLEHPMFGQGVGTFVNKLTEVYIFRYEFGDPVDAHSIITKLSAEQGLVGLITFSLFVGSIALCAYQRLKNKKYSREARLTAYLALLLIIAPVFFQFFNTQYYSARMWVPIMLGIALLLAYRHDHAETQFYSHLRPDKYYFDTTITD